MEYVIVGSMVIYWFYSLLVVLQIIPPMADWKITKDGLQPGDKPKDK